MAAFGLVALPPLSITYLNSNTAFLASIIVGNGINSGIILLARFQEERGAGRALEPAIVSAFSASFRPTLASAAAAATAYGSLVFTDFRGFNQFGWIGGIGMLCCWGATFLVTPALLRCVPVDAKASSGRRIGAADSRSVCSAASSIARHRCRAFRCQRSVSRGAPATGSKTTSASSGGAILANVIGGARMNATLGRYLTPSVVMADSAEHAREIEARLGALKERGAAGQLISAVHSSRSILPPRRTEARVEAQKLAAALTPRLRAELSERDRAFVERALAAGAERNLEIDDVPGVVAGRPA